MRKLIVSLGCLALLFGAQASASKYSAAERADIKLARQAIKDSPLVPKGAKRRFRDFKFSVMGPLRFVDGHNFAGGTGGEVRVLIDPASKPLVIHYSKTPSITDQQPAGGIPNPGQGFRPVLVHPTVPPVTTVPQPSPGIPNPGQGHRPSLAQNQGR